MNNNEIIIVENSSDSASEETDSIYSLQTTAVASSDYTCPVCACTVLDDEEQHVCENCHTPHHKDCWDYAEGCAIFGCRKGIIRQPTAGSELRNRIAPVNLGIMKVWNLLFKVHWLTFLVTALGVISSSILGTFYGVYPVVELFTGYFGLYFISVMNLLLICTGLAIPLGALAYMLLLPLAIVMRIHFHTINLALPQGNSAMAKSVADRIDMPQTVTVVRTISNVLTRVSEFMLVFWAIIGILFLFVDTSIAQYIGAAFAGTLFIRFAMLNLFRTALESRVTILMTFQNRLIASAKQSKNQ